MVTFDVKTGKRSDLLRAQREDKLGFTFTETIKAYKGRGKLGGREFFISNTSSLHYHHKNDSASRWAVV